MKYFIVFFALILTAMYSNAKIWTVSPNGEYKFCSQINTFVEDGDTIEIESASYNNDKQVTWSANNLFIRGVNGRPILRAGEIIENDNSNGKGIFVIRGNNTCIENIEFQNCKVQSRNGAGIRQEGSNLIVRNCVFNSNEMGILQGGTITNCSILVEFCEFLSSGSPENPGYQHNIYINHIDTLIFRYNFSHDAIAEGHEFKSRANNNYILYNRISNLNSIDSRNIDLPNGGQTLIMGNIIEQGESSANSNIIGFGMEGLTNLQPHKLLIVNNTIVNRKSKGSFIQIANIAYLLMTNNICVGAKTGGFIIGTADKLDTNNNLINDDISYPKFVDLFNSDFHLQKGSPAINSGFNFELLDMGYILKPDKEYKPVVNFDYRANDDSIDIGAFEYEFPENVEASTDNSEVVIFPIPTKDYFKICSNKLPFEKVKIFNPNGELESAIEINHGNQLIDVSQLSVGFYIVEIKFSNKTNYKKLIIMR